MFLLRDWEQVCTLHLTRVCAPYEWGMLRVHSDSCIIPSPTTTSKIGHLRSGRAITLSELMESDCAKRRNARKKNNNENKGVTDCCESALVIQVYMRGFWFVFSSVLICSAESSMLKFGLFSAAPGKRQILSDCTSQTQFNI